MLLIIRNFLIVCLCFVTYLDIYATRMTFLIADPPSPPCTCMFCFLWKNHFSSILYMSRCLCIIWHWHMLLYAGIYWDSGAWRAPNPGCWWPTSPPPRYMYVSLSLKTSFSVHVVYVSFSLYFLILTYVTLCRHIVSQWCLKSTKSRLLVSHLSAPRYMYVSLSLKKSFFVHVVYVSFSFSCPTLTYVTLCMLLVR